MPVTTQGQQTEQFRVTIKKLFRDCPKPNGWFAGYAHIRGGDDIKVVGKSTEIMVMEGLVLDITGFWKNQDKEEFNITEMTPVTKTRTGMTTYLASLPGISRPTANKLVLSYGSAVLDIIKTDPGRIKREMNFSDKVMTALTKGVCADNIMNQLRQMLPGFSEQLVKRVHEMWPDAVNIIKQDPYRLQEISGVSFGKADTVALSLGFDPLHPYRVNHGLTHVLDTCFGNDTFVDIADPEQLNRLTTHLEYLLSVRFQSVDEIAKRAEVLAAIPVNAPVIIEHKNGQKRLFLSSVHNSVTTVTNCIRIGSKMPYAQGQEPNTFRNLVTDLIHEYEARVSMNLTDEQNFAVMMSAGSHISVITGGPGRGKTTIVDCLASVMEFLLQKTDNIMLLAPTGRAMNKLRTATKQRYNTMTIDRLIVSATEEEKSKSNLTRELGSLVKGHYSHMNSKDKIFIIDESSMVDIEKIARLMFLFPKTRYCFVGDIDQLPPIGKGRFLYDLIQSKCVPVTYLTEPLRNGGLILANATKISKGQTDLAWDFTEMPFFPQPEDNEEALNAILEQYNDERANCPDITDIALLCPVKRGTIGVVSLNRALQDIACPERICQPTVDQRHGCKVFAQKGHPIQSTIYGDGTSKNWTRFRVGDIVMNTKNQYGIICTKYTNDDYWNGRATKQTIGIFNGDCGRIIGYFPSASLDESVSQNPHEFVVVQFFNNMIAAIDVTMGEFEHFELGYAMTVHKSQGCEYKVVIYVSPNSLSNMKGFAVRNLPYTGVTRAKERVVIIGSKDSLMNCIQNPLPPCNSDFTERV